MTRRHVQVLQRAARAVRGHIEYRTRSGRLALPDGSVAFARLCVAEVPRELRGRVAGWRLGVWRVRSPGGWAVECWPEVRPVSDEQAIAAARDLAGWRGASLWEDADGTLYVVERIGGPRTTAEARAGTIAVRRAIS